MEQKTFKVEITETLQRVVEVSANSVDEAISKVHKAYCEEDIVLDSNDHITTEIVEFPQH